MSYNAIIRAKYLRASGLFGHGRGWDVGSNASLGIGIPSRLVRKISERTNPFNIIDGELLDDRNLVVVQNTLSGLEDTEVNLRLKLMELNLNDIT